MIATNTREHKDQKEIRIFTVSLRGKVQVFQHHGAGDRVYIEGTTLCWKAEEFDAALGKMRAAGATVEESAGFAFGAAR